MCGARKGHPMAAAFSELFAEDRGKGLRGRSTTAPFGQHRLGRLSSASASPPSPPIAGVAVVILNSLIWPCGNMRPGNMLDGATIDRNPTDRRDRTARAGPAGPAASARVAVPCRTSILDHLPPCPLAGVHRGLEQSGPELSLTSAGTTVGPEIDDHGHLAAALGSRGPMKGGLGFRPLIQVGCGGLRRPWPCPSLQHRCLRHNLHVLAPIMRRDPPHARQGFKDRMSRKNRGVGPLGSPNRGRWRRNAAGMARVRDVGAWPRHGRGARALVGGIPAARAIGTTSCRAAPRECPAGGDVDPVRWPLCSWAMCSTSIGVVGGAFGGGSRPSVSALCDQTSSSRGAMFRSPTRMDFLGPVGAEPVAHLGQEIELVAEFFSFRLCGRVHRPPRGRRNCGSSPPVLEPAATWRASAPLCRTCRGGPHPSSGRRDRMATPL